MSREEEQSLAEESTGVLDPTCLPSDALCCLTAELLRKGHLSFLKGVKQLLSTPGLGREAWGSLCSGWQREEEEGKPFHAHTMLTEALCAHSP